jgi:hypothetical protein
MSQGRLINKKNVSVNGMMRDGERLEVEYKIIFT